MKKRTDDETDPYKDQVTCPVEGTVVNWASKTQVNHTTGQVFDFAGKLLDPHQKSGYRKTWTGDDRPDTDESSE